MKGVVLSLPTKDRSKGRRGGFAFSGFNKRYLSLVIFTLFFTAGVVWGALVSLNADKGLLEDMDFLFTTNLDTRLSQGLLSTFAAHFASNFIFLIAALLCAFSPWGVGVLPAVVAFKGFGTGLSAAYLMSSYALKGAGFYLVVVLPGTFVFSLCLLFMCTECHTMSLRIARCVFGIGDNTLPVSSFVKSFLFRSAYFLFISAIGALLDMLLWSFVSGLFF